MVKVIETNIVIGWAPHGLCDNAYLSHQPFTTYIEQPHPYMTLLWSHILSEDGSSVGFEVRMTGNLAAGS